MLSTQSTLTDLSTDGIVNHVFGPEQSLLRTENSPKTYKLVMDNIDKTVKPNDMRMDNQTKSMHYVHKYAVLDRIDLSSFDDKPCSPDISKIRLDALLPNKQDREEIRQNMGVLVAHVLIRNLPFLKKFSSCHRFSEEMSQKSEVVCLHSILP